MGLLNKLLGRSNPSPEFSAALSVGAEIVTPERPNRTDPARFESSIRRGDGFHVIPDRAMDWSQFDDCRRVSVVGYDHHQPALQAVGRGLVVGTDRLETSGELVLEPGNAHDSNAVAVVVDSRCVGYLKSATAKRLQKRLLGIVERGEVERYTLLVRGQPDTGLLQAHLQIPYSSKLLEGYKNPRSSA